MNFMKRQEEKIALHILKWRYQKLGLPLPPTAELQRRAAQIVEDAHGIARDRGRNVIAIMKDLAQDIKGNKNE